MSAVQQQHYTLEIGSIQVGQVVRRKGKEKGQQTEAAGKAVW
jgi:hypothetical protein